MHPVMPHVISLPIDPSTIQFGNCTTGDVQFANFSDNPNEDSRQGTIQICVNNAWGFVCGDDFFDSTDASVFCGQLTGFTGTGDCNCFILSSFDCL